MNKLHSIIVWTAFALSWTSCDNIWVWNWNLQSTRDIINKRVNFQLEYRNLMQKLSENSRLYFAPLVLDEWITISSHWNAEKYFIFLSHAEIHWSKIISKVYWSWEIEFSYLIWPVWIEWIKQKDGWFENNLSTNDYEKWYETLTNILQQYNKHN